MRDSVCQRHKALFPKSNEQIRRARLVSVLFLLSHSIFRQRDAIFMVLKMKGILIHHKSPFTHEGAPGMGRNECLRIRGSIPYSTCVGHFPLIISGTQSRVVQDHSERCEERFPVPLTCCHYSPHMKCLKATSWELWQKELQNINQGNGNTWAAQRHQVGVDLDRPYGEMD